MNKIRTPARAVGLVLAVGGLLTGCAAQAATSPARAAATSPARAAAPPRVPAQVACGSPAAWLKLSSLIVTLSSGAHTVSTCYTGDGTRTVAVPQVQQAAVRAGHTACLSLYQNGRMLHVCIAGPGSRRLELPTVMRIDLITKH